MDSESMSRSSVKDLSAVTSDALTPATSSTISARPARISSELLTVWFLSQGGCRRDPAPGGGTTVPGAIVP
jgi:hypothetical protein